MAKATVKIKNIPAVKKEVVFRLNRAIRDSGALEEVADDMIKTIRSGKDPTTNQSYKPLSSSWIARRKKLSAVNLTGEGYSASRSNLTFTGQLIKSIKATIQTARNTITVQATGTHKGYKLIKGGRSKNMRNSELAKHLENPKNGENQGRTLIGVSELSVKRFVIIIRKAVGKYLERR